MTAGVLDGETVEGNWMIVSVIKALEIVFNSPIK